MPDTLVQQALSANPELSAIEHRIQTLKYKAQAVQRWMDPVLSVEYGNFPVDTWNMGDSPMTGVQVKLSQTFSLAGKNDRREATVQARKQAMRWNLAEKRNVLAAEVKRVYWTLALSRQLRIITIRHIKALEQLLEVVKAKYQSGAVAQHDLMRLELLRDKLADDLQDFERQNKELTAVLNAVLHREPTVRIETPETFQPESQTSRNLAQWFERARKDRPQVKALEGQARAKNLEAEQVAYERWPDVTVWAGYRIRTRAGVDDGTDQMSLGLSVPLPFDYTGSSDAERNEHLSEAAAIQAESTSLLDRIHADLEAALAAWQRFSDKARTYSDVLIPNATRTWDSSLAAYQSGQAEFATLYAVEIQLLEFERELWAATVQTYLQRIRMEELSGLAAGQSEKDVEP